MPSKRVRLYIDSDASGVQKGVGQAQRSLRGFENQAKRTSSVMGGLSTGASSLGLAFGAAGLAVGIRGSIDAFKEQEKSSARVIATLKTLGVNTDAVRKKIQDVTTAQAKLSGFQDEDLQASFSTILRVTKDVNESLRLNALAMDIARGSGKDLNAVSVAIAKVADGNAGALGRYGVKAEKGATATDVLTKAQQRFAGQAREFGNTTAGAADKANAQINELQESIGAKLAPAMNSAAGATIKLAGATGNFVDQAGGIGPIVAGAAGFGAFRLLAPSIANAGSALGALGKVAGSQGAGASFRVLGSAVASSVSPMNAATIGAGLLAGGIYALASSSESADQAVNGLNGTVKGLYAALDQKAVAVNAVNTARDYVNTTRDAIDAAKASGASEKVLIPLIHQHQSALTSLKSAQTNLRQSTDGVNAAQDAQSRKAQDVIGKVEKQARLAQNLAGNWREYGKQGRDGFDLAAGGASRFAALMDRAAERTARTDSAVSKVDANLAGFARRVGRIPSTKEIKLITNFTAQGQSLDTIQRKLDAIRSKEVTVRFNQTFNNAPNPLTGISPSARRSSGGFIPGRYSAGDRVPAMLSGEEAVLNPRQIDMLGRDAVVGVLKATGAPTGFATGKIPARGGSSTRVGPTTGSLVDRALDRRMGAWDFAQARSQLGIAQADGDAGRSVGAYRTELATDTARRNAIQAILKNPGKALGVPGGRLTQSQRTALLQALAATISEINDDNQTIYNLLHPSATDTGGGGDDGGGVGTSTDTPGPSPDLQAQLDRQIALTAVATKGQRLSDATLATFTGSGDIGTGNYANAFSAAAQLTWSRPATTREVAAASNEGNGQQASITANRVSVNI